jgi:two-component system OmpR family response regulator
MFHEHSAKVLVVDDDPGITEIVDAFLSTAGYDVSVENTSESAIRKAKEWRPDVILLDIMMPHMDGYDVAETLKDEKSMQQTPIIFLTGKDAEEDQGRSFRAGGNLYVKKPFSCERLLDIVKIVLMSVNK